MTTFRRIDFCLLAACAVALAASRVQAVVLIEDDFSGAGSGTGWAVGNDWEGLDGGLVSTDPTGTPNVQSFRDFAQPLDGSGGVVYIKVDYAQTAPGTGEHWGGLAFFTGTEGAAGDETLFVGNTAGSNRYGIDLKNGGILVGPKPIDDQFHTLIAKIDTLGTDHVYSFWVDNVNVSVPSASTTVVGGGPITQVWNTLRLAGADEATDNFDNLLIATTPADVGLVASTITMTVNRATGDVSLSSSSPLANVVGYSISSSAGSLEAAGWTPVTGNYDSSGSGLVDPDDAWAILSTDPSDTTLLSEEMQSGTPGDGGTIGTTAANLGSVWNRSPFEDLFATVVVDEGGTSMMLAADVVYTGTGPALGDLDGDGDLDASDWTLFKSGQGAVDNSLTAVAAYQMGDLNGDYDHDLSDFDLFAEAYDAANGTGAFAAMVQGVPEPGALALALCGGLACAMRSRRRIKFALALLAAVTLAASNFAGTARAVIFAQDDFSAEGSGTGWASGDIWENVTGGVADTAFGNAKFRALDVPFEPYFYDKVYIAFDIQFTAADQWGGVAFFEGIDGGTESLFIGDPGGDGYDVFGLDLKQGQNLPGDPTQGITIDNGLHRLIVELDFDDDFSAPFDDKYSLWVDNVDPNNPTHTVTIQNSPIQQAWQSVRLQSAGGGEFFKVDNFILTDDANLVFSPTLNLVVDKATGEVSIRNATGAAIEMSAYSIESAAGALNTGALPGDFDASGAVDGEDFLNWQQQVPTLDADDLADWQVNYGGTGGGTGGWDSLADQDLAGFPAGDGSGNGWEEGANPGPGEVEEYFLAGESSVADGVTLALGNAYAGGAAGVEDLRFLYRSGGELKVGTVSYEGGAATGAVPEPASVALAAIAATAAVFCQRRRGRGTR